MALHLLCVNVLLVLYLFELEHVFLSQLMMWLDCFFSSLGLALTFVYLVRQTGHSALLFRLQGAHRQTYNWFHLDPSLGRISNVALTVSVISLKSHF